MVKYTCNRIIEKPGGEGNQSKRSIKFCSTNPHDMSLRVTPQRQGAFIKRMIPVAFGALDAKHPPLLEFATPQEKLLRLAKTSNRFGVIRRRLCGEAVPIFFGLNIHSYDARMRMSLNQPGEFASIEGEIASIPSQSLRHLASTSWNSNYQT
jgi:hypothetical protein